MTWTRLAIGAAGIALIVFLLLRFGEAREEAGRLAERVAWERREAKILVDQAETIATARLEAERRVAGAVRAHADELSRIEPIIIRSTDTVTRYAETPAGRELCLDPVRVRGIEDSDAALRFTPAAGAAGESAHPVRDPAAQD